MNPITEVLEIIETKSIDNYKIIEDRYLTLRMYLKYYFQKYETIDKMHFEILLKALDKNVYIEENQVEKDKCVFVDEKEKDYFKVGDKVRLDKLNECTNGFVKGEIYEITEIENDDFHYFNITISDKKNEIEGYVSKYDISKVEEGKDD